MGGTGDDLLVLAIDAWHGKLREPKVLAVGLRAASLVELVGAGTARLETRGGPTRIVVEDGVVAADGPLGMMLDVVEHAAEPRTPARVVGSRRWGNVVAFHLERLGAAGVVEGDGGRPVGDADVRLRVRDAARRKAARDRVDAAVTAAASGTKRLSADGQFAGIVAALGLGGGLYAGLRGRRSRERLADLARRSWAARAVEQCRSPDRGSVQDSEGLRNIDDTLGRYNYGSSNF